MSERRAITWIGRVALIAISVLAVAIGIEIALRIGSAEARDTPGPREIGLTELAIPGIEGSFAGHPYRTNDLGFRAPNYETRAPADVFRILSTGDSITMG